MADQRIDIDIKINSKTGEISLKSLDKSFDTLKIKAGQAQQAAKALNLEISQITSAGNVNVAANNFGTLQKQIGGASAASGSASSSVLELGRVISDSNYGIRGMANNFSQLASNLLFTAKAAGGFGAALGQVGKALMGPLGLLLLIQSGIALLERWSMSSSKAAKDSESMGKSAGVAASNLKILLRANELNNMSLNEASRAAKRANNEYKDLGVEIDKNGKLTDSSVEAINRKIEALERLAKAQAIQTMVEKKYAEVIALTIKLDAANELSMKEYEKSEVLRAKAEEDRASGAVSRENRIEQDAVNAERSFKRSIKNITELTKERGVVEGEINKLIQLIPDVGDLFSQTKGGEGSLGKIFKKQFLDLEKFIISSNRREALLVEKNEVKKLDIKQKYAKKDLKNRRDTFTEKQEQRLADFMKSKANDEEKAAAQATFDASKIQAETEYQKALTSLVALQTSERFELQLKLLREFNERMLKARGESAEALVSFGASSGAGTSAGSVGRPMSAVGAEGVDAQTEAMRAAGVIEEQQFEEALARKREQLELQNASEFQIKMELGEMQYQFDLDQATREIELEQMKIDAKKNINLEYISWSTSIASTLRNLAGENEGLAKAALAIEKGAKIASIIIETSAANQKISAIATVQAQNPITAGLATLAPARIIKNNIGAGLSIANILATGLNSKSNPSAGSGGAVGGGGGESREFDFNLVGSTGVNQLAQGIGGQFDQPIQAYVVSSQMTSQQQLDNVIQSSATIGD